MLYVCYSSDLPTKIWSCRLHSRPGKACKKNCGKYHVIFPRDYLTHQKHMSFLFRCDWGAFLQVCHCHVSLQVKPKTSLSELSYLHHTSCIHFAYATAPCIKISITWQPGTKVSETTGMHQSFPGGAVLNKKLTLSLGEKKTYVERTENFPLASISSPASVHPDFRLRQLGPCLFGPQKWGMHSEPHRILDPRKNGGLPEVESSKWKPLKNGGPTGRWSEFPGLGVEVAGFQLEKKILVFFWFFLVGNIQNEKWFHYPKKT